MAPLSMYCFKEALLSPSRYTIRPNEHESYNEDTILIIHIIHGLETVFSMLVVVLFHSQIKQICLSTYFSIQQV